MPTMDDIRRIRAHAELDYRNSELAARKEYQNMRKFDAKTRKEALKKYMVTKRNAKLTLEKIIKRCWEMMRELEETEKTQ